MAIEADNDVTHQLCAMIVQKNRVLSVGYNSSKTHPISSATKMQQIHAEMHALVRSSGADLNGAEVIVARARPSGKPGLSKPCETCEALLRRAGIRKVFYTTNSEDPEFPEIEEMKL